MGPLWADIMDHIHPVVDDEWETDDRTRPPAKLAIYSGYDSTIMEILASLGAWEAKEWPPYASMVLLEVSCAEAESLPVPWSTRRKCEAKRLSCPGRKRKSCISTISSHRVSWLLLPPFACLLG